MCKKVGSPQQPRFPGVNVIPDGTVDFSETGVCMCTWTQRLTQPPTEPLIFNLLSIRDQPHQSRETGETLISKSLNGVPFIHISLSLTFPPICKEMLISHTE